MNVLTMQDVRKSFGSLEVLKGISLTVGEGEAVSVIGPSRAAANPRCCAARRCLETMDGGSLAYGELDFARDDGRGGNERLRGQGCAAAGCKSPLRAGVPAVQPFPALHACIKNVTDAPLHRAEARARTRCVELALSLLEKMGPCGQGGRLVPCQLSGGQQQRVAIARALCAAARHPLFRRADQRARPRADAARCSRSSVISRRKK